MWVHTPWRQPLTWGLCPSMLCGVGAGLVCQCFSDLSCYVRGLRLLSHSGLSVTALGVRVIPFPLCGVGGRGGRMRSFQGHT